MISIGQPGAAIRAGDETACVSLFFSSSLAVRFAPLQIFCAPQRRISHSTIILLLLLLYAREHTHQHSLIYIYYYY